MPLLRTPPNAPPTPAHRSSLLRKTVVAVTGGTVLMVGVAMVVLPGPAVVVIPAGLAILATEFLWARHALRKAKEMVARAIRANGGGQPPSPNDTGPDRSEHSSATDERRRGSSQKRST
ncbi:MAG TPA: PGPGW domain-containing protein [Methylomirabilota bacterium]|nr:PGPGW domain-containing protein [Methylomirabilota bacterium]